MCNTNGYIGVKCVLNTLDMTFDNCTRWCVVKVCNCKCACAIAGVDVKCKWVCKFACMFVNV